MSPSRNVFSAIYGHCFAATTLSDSRSSFEMYRGHTKIINAGARDQLSKLSPSECRRHCLDEKRFTCQSVASCVYGDCIISDLHGDELLNDTNGQANIGAHTHCVVWTRKFSLKRLYMYTICMHNYVCRSWCIVEYIMTTQTYKSSHFIFKLKYMFTRMS